MFPGILRIQVPAVVRVFYKRGGFMGFLLANAESAQIPAGTLGALLPLILIFIVFYFLLILPQQRKQKAHKKMLQDLKEGDKVITVGGLMGNVSKIKDSAVVLEFRDGVKIDFARNSISQVIRPENQG